MGIIRPATSNVFNFSDSGDLKIVSNSADGSMGFEHNASGIPFIRTDTSFSGDHDETIDNSGTVELVQYQGVDDTVSNDDTYIVLDETFTSNYDVFVNLSETYLASGEVVSDGAGTTFTNGTDYDMDYTNGQIKVLSTGGMADATTYYIDFNFDSTKPFEDTNGAELFFEDLMQTDFTSRYFDGVGVYVSQPYSVGACRRVYADSVAKTENIPTNTILTTEYAVSYDGGVSYEDWTTLNGALFNQGEILEDVFVKYRFTFEATSDGVSSPSVSEWKHSLDSFTVMKIESTGEVRYANSDYTNYSEVI